MKEYHIGDVIEYKGLNENLSGHVQKTGFILKINKNGTFIVGNAFVDYQDIVPAMLDMNIIRERSFSLSIGRKILFTVIGPK